jgi:hypothetical protein
MTGSQPDAMTRREAFAWVAAGITIPSVAEAYLLPNEHVLKRVGTRLKRRGDLQVTLVGRARLASGLVSVGERWMFTGRQVQVDVNGPGKRTLTWRRGGQAEGDALLIPTEAERMVFTRLFADRDTTALARDLRVDLDASHLALLGDRVAHVVGLSFAGRRDRRAPAIWVDQERFEVLRVRVPGRPNVELRLSDWHGPATQGVFPQKTQVTAGGRWVRRLEVDEAAVVGAR